MSDKIHAAEKEAASLRGNERNRETLDLISKALLGLQYGQLTILVQDGVVVQIERTEKRRLR